MKDSHESFMGMMRMKDEDSQELHEGFHGGGGTTEELILNGQHWDRKRALSISCTGTSGAVPPAWESSLISPLKPICILPLLSGACPPWILMPPPYNITLPWPWGGFNVPPPPI